jgi:hypothetical protein
LFESIAYKNRIGPGPLIDVGALAEGLIFYRKVAVVGTIATIRDLLSQIPPLIVLSLLQEGRLELHVVSGLVSVYSQQLATGENRYAFSTLSPVVDVEKSALTSFIDLAGGSTQAKFGARQFVKQIKLLDVSSFDQNSVLNDAMKGNILQRSVETMLKELVPTTALPSALTFAVHHESDGLAIETNLDFAELNRAYHKVVPVEHSSLSEAYVLSLFQGMHEASFFAATLNSEIALTSVERAVHATAIQDLLDRCVVNQSQVSAFTEMTFKHAHAIRDAVNAGRVPFAEVVRLARSADKFRDWLHKLPEDSSVVSEFYSALVSKTWVEKIPAKTTRWGIFTGAGLAVDLMGGGGAGTAVGIGLSAFDQFLLDKILNGWKPHQFVEDEFKKVFAP